MVDLPMIEFYDNDMSVCAQKVRLVLAAKGLDYERHHLDLRAGDQLQPDYLKLNPKGVVPTLVDNGTVVIESTVIIAYLDDAYAELNLTPNDAKARADMLYWMILPDGSLHDACGLTSFSLAFRQQLSKLPPEALQAHFAKIPDETRRSHIRNLVELGLDAPGVEAAVRTYRKSVRAMAKPLENNNWLAGNQWSLADVTMVPYVLRLVHLGLDTFWSDLPQISEWFERCKARAEYAAIEDHINPGYVSLMGSAVAEQSDRVREIVKG